MDVVIKEFSCCVILRRIGSIKKERKGKERERKEEDIQMMLSGPTQRRGMTCGPLPYYYQL